jgi:hypothetical protein
LGEEADHRVGERLGALDRRQVAAALDHLEPRAAISRVVDPSNDRSENKSAAAARIRSRVGSADGRVTRKVLTES